MKNPMMKKFAIPLAALAALAVAAPTLAQAAPRDHHGGGYAQIAYGQSRDYDTLRFRINQGVKRGDITRFEAKRLYGRLDSLRDREISYMRGGLSRWERNDLAARYDKLSEAVFRQRHDDQDRRWR